MADVDKNRNLVIKWITRRGIKNLKQFEHFFTKEFFKGISNYTKKTIARLTIEAYIDIRKLWSGQLLDARTGRMLRSLQINIKEENDEFYGKVWSERSFFRDTFYYPLTHEAFDRPYTLITPKKARYLTIPPYPRKGYFRWVKTKKVKIPKRPAFQYVVEDLRDKKIPKKLKETKKIAIKLFKEGGS